MAWPSTVVAGQSLLASQFNGVVAALSAWGGAVSAAGFALSDLSGAALHSSNATWQEWQAVATVGGSLAADTWDFQYNARATSGGADAWANAFSVNRSGQTTFTGPAVFNSTVALNGVTTFNASANLNGQTFSGNATFSGTVTFSGSATFSTPANLTFGSNWGGAWTPVATPFGTMTLTNVTFPVAYFLRIGPIIFFQVYMIGTVGGTPTNQVDLSLPLTPFGSANAATVGQFSQGTFVGVPAFISPVNTSGGITGTTFIRNPSNFVAGQLQINITGFYRV